MFYSSFSSIAVGGLIYIFSHFLKYYPGIRNNHVMTASNSSRGYLGIIIGILLTSFYCIYYWGGDGVVKHFVALFEHLSWTLRHRAADKYFCFMELCIPLL